MRYAMPRVATSLSLRRDAHAIAAFALPSTTADAELLGDLLHADRLILVDSEELRDHEW